MCPSHVCHARSVDHGLRHIPANVPLYLPGAPYIELLSTNRRLQAALTGVTAAVVGVIANLAVFFGIHVLFPDSGGLHGFAVVLAVASVVVLRRFSIPTYWLVPGGALAGIVWVMLGVR